MLPEGWPHLLKLCTGRHGATVTRWQDTRLDMLWLVGLSPVMIHALFQQPLTWLGLVVIALITMQLWHFALPPQGAAASPFMSVNNVLQVLLFLLLLPVNVQPLQLILAIGFGTVFGERLYGGRGYAFLNPVIVGLSFYLFSHTVAMDELVISSVPLLLLVPAAIGLIVFELISWRTLLAVCIGGALVLTIGLTDMASTRALAQTLASSTALWLAIVFLAADPASGGSSNPSRWVHGLFCGALVVILSEISATLISAIIFAILLASLSAPLIDHGVMTVHVIRRRARRG